MTIDTPAPATQSQDVETLQRRIAELEAQVQHYQHREPVGDETKHSIDELRQKESSLRMLLNNLPVAVSSIDSTMTITMAGGKALVDAGLTSEMLIGQKTDVLFADFPEAIQTMKEALQGTASSLETCRGGRFYENYYVPIYDDTNAIVGASTMSIDVTERKQAEEVLRRTALQEEVIYAQQATLAELSTPLLAINEGVVVMPLVGTVDSRRAQQVMENLLQGIADNQAEVVILDITGVSVVDTQVANAFLRAAQAVKLLGAQVIITGIRPEVAQTLVGLGVDLAGIITRNTLQDGIAWALGKEAKPTFR
ncbi:MAG: STAS domain-containing protein [Chloroflexaceae bacterium]|jgi:rsbT co-antagonist protein RsbR|nr:STAS domain-containing protein [Chloroflexaceae bacterium]